jgi:hypothetical protein
VRRRSCPRPHLRRSLTRRCHICAGTGLTPCRICAGPHLRRDSDSDARCAHEARARAGTYCEYTRPPQKVLLGCGGALARTCSQSFRWVSGVHAGECRKLDIARRRSTPLHQAAKANKVDMLSALVASGATLAAKDNFGSLPPSASPPEGLPRPRCTVSLAAWYPTRLRMDG